MGNVSSLLRERKRLRLLLGLLKELMRVRLAGVGLSFVLICIFCAVLAPLVAPHNPIAQDWELIQAPSWLHPLGTDQIGRDSLSRMIYGSRISIMVGFAAVAVAMVLGIPIGLVSGYYGEKTDQIMMRIMDALLSFPVLLLTLCLVAALGPGLRNTIIAIGVTFTPVFARVIRGQVLSVREEEYVTAARALGAHDRHIILQHILPNVLSPLIVVATINMAYAILIEASLSFLGVGVRPPMASWGMMLREGYPYLRTAWWLSIFPGLAIFLLVLGLNLLGDALLDVLNPRLRRTLRQGS